MTTVTIATDAPPLTDDQERAWLAYLSACLKYAEFTGPPYWSDDKRTAADEVIRTRANFHAIRVRDGLGDFTWAGWTWRLGRDGFEMHKD